MIRIVMLPLKLVAAAAKVVAAATAIVAFGAGIPFFWVWLGSQLQGGTAPSLTGLGVVLVGLTASYTLLAVLFAWLKERLQPSVHPVRHDWNRSLSAERLRRGQTTHALEDVVAVATIVVGLACTVWFFLFGNPGVPVGT